jgi:hypothetical protein
MLFHTLNVIKSCFGLSYKKVPTWQHPPSLNKKPPKKFFCVKFLKYQGDTMKGVKWAGTLLCLIGIALTSFNVYPANIVLSLIGSVLWTWAGWAQKDTPLFLVEVVAVVFYLAGIVALFY